MQKSSHDIVFPRRLGPIKNQSLFMFKLYQGDFTSCLIEKGKFALVTDASDDDSSSEDFENDFDVDEESVDGKRLKCVKQSAVSDHLLECNCPIDFDHFDILASDANKFRLLIKESLLIKRDQPQLNKTIKSFPLKLFD